MKNYFEGLYFKHQKNGRTLALIPGRSDNNAFIQVITDDNSYQVSYPLHDYSRRGTVRIGGNIFSNKGIKLDVHTKDLDVTGVLKYSGLNPISGDIMGPFRFLPMECRHSIVSMKHRVDGCVILNGEPLRFDGGTGYIEGDRGTSFPASYSWVQSNSFNNDCSIVASAAKIPMGLFKFWGCICVVRYNGCEYRLATYKGARLVKRSKNGFEIRQGKDRLIVTVPRYTGYALAAPDNGKMCRTVHESPSCKARFQFYRQGLLMFDELSEYASYEYVE